MNYRTSQCVFCGGQVAEHDVEEVLRGGNDTAVLRVRAGVCERCGERYFDGETVQRFEEIERKLNRRDTKGFREIGRSYEVA